MQCSDKSVCYVLRALPQATDPPFTDIDLLIVCTHEFCDSETSCLHGPNAKRENLTRVPICIHQERKNATSTPNLCRPGHHVHHAWPPEEKVYQ